MERQASGLKLSLGDQAPYFSLKGTDGKIHTISDFSGARAFLVVFTCNHCPYARAYESRLNDIAKDFTPQGLKMIAICANDPRGYPEDDFDHMVARSKEMGFPYPYLQDENQIVAQAYDAACTPEAYLFDGDLCMRYHGRIDDNYKDASSVTKHELREAISALLAGSVPEIPLTPAMGCSIKWKP